MQQQLRGESCIPRYIQIADILQSEIERMLYQVGEKLPSESQLCRRFQENRYTVRQALELLMNAGIIRAHQGKGHYVCEKPLNLQYTITPGTRFSDVMAKLGCRPRATILQQEQCIAPEPVAKALHLQPHEEVYRLEILRFADEIALTWNVTWLPVDCFPGLLDRLFPFRFLYALLEDCYGVRLHRISSTFQSTFPNAQEALYLQISPNTNLLHIESVMKDNDGRRVEFTSAKYRGDLCKVSIEFD